MNDYYEKDYESNYKKPKPRKKSKKISTRLLMVIQITVCSIILVTAILIRIFGGNAYAVIKNWYVQNMNNSIVADEQIQNVKHSVVELFPWNFNPPSASGTVSSVSSQPSVSSQQSMSSQSAASTPQQNNSQQVKS
jgi:hypothetical protein